jgi:hypothetical protein
MEKCVWGEREKMRAMPGFYTDREGKGEAGKGPVAAHLPLMASGFALRALSGIEKGKRKGNKGK